MIAQPTILTCFEALLDLAEREIPKKASAEGASAERLSRKAIVCMKGFLSSHSDEMLVLALKTDGVEGLRDDSGEIPEIDLYDIECLCEDPLSDAPSIVFNLACSHFRTNGVRDEDVIEVDGVEIPAGDAVNLAALFWEAHHAELLDGVSLTIDEGRYIVADPDAEGGSGWGHIFPGDRLERLSRFIYDRQEEKLLHVEIRYTSSWQVAVPGEVEDLEDSLKNANEDALENAADWGLVVTDLLPDWAPDEVRVALGVGSLSHGSDEDLRP